MGFGVKNGILEENGRAKGLLGRKWGLQGKWLCKETFELKMRFLGENGHAKGFLG